MRYGIRHDEKQPVLESDCLMILTDADGTVQLIQADFIWDKITTVERCNNLLVVHSYVHDLELANGGTSR